VIARQEKRHECLRHGPRERQVQVSEGSDGASEQIERLRSAGERRNRGADLQTLGVNRSTPPGGSASTAFPHDEQRIRSSSHKEPDHDRPRPVEAAA
jgi:hypothetical protein